MSRYVLLFRGNEQDLAKELLAVEAMAGLTLLEQRPSGIFLVEYSGPAEELFAQVRRLNDWVASELRTYRLA